MTQAKSSLEDEGKESWWGEYTVSENFKDLVGKKGCKLFSEFQVVGQIAMSINCNKKDWD